MGAFRCNRGSYPGARSQKLIGELAACKTLENQHFAPVLAAVSAKLGRAGLFPCFLRKIRARSRSDAQKPRNCSHSAWDHYSSRDEDSFSGDGSGQAIVNGPGDGHRSVWSHGRKSVERAAHEAFRERESRTRFALAGDTLTQSAARGPRTPRRTIERRRGEPSRVINDGRCPSMYYDRVIPASTSASAARWARIGQEALERLRPDRVCPTWYKARRAHSTARSGRY